MNHKITTLTKTILTAFCLLLLNISIKAQSNTVTIGNMGTGYVTAISPFNNYYNYSWSDNIYLTTDIGQAGKITQIAFYVYEGSTYSMGSQKILMRETSVSSFTSSAYPGETGFTTVFNGTISYNFSGNSGWQVVTLTTPFTYDGLSNLEILCENQAGTWTSSYQLYDVTLGYSNKRQKADYSDASLPTTCVNCTYATQLTNIQLTMTCAANMTVSPSNPSVCNGGSTSLTASGESTYTWSPSTGLSGTSGASVTANPTVTTVYSVSGTDAGSCIQTQTVTVTVNAAPTINITPSSATICPGSSTTLTASGASTYTWSPTTGLSASTGASVTANPTVTTTYTVTGTGSNGCTNTKTVVVNVNSAPSLTFSPSSPAVCIGSTTTITASGANSYTWSPSTGLNITTSATVSANPTVTTTYSISATGSNGCAGTKTLSVVVNPLPTLTLSPSSPAVCTGSTTTLTASGAITYTWSPNTALSATTGASITASPTATTNYTLTGTNANGCVNSSSFSIAVNGLPSLSISPSSATICTGNSTNLTASGATTYTWSPSTGLNTTTGSTVTANTTNTTTYSISGTNSNGCVGTTTVTVNVNPLPTLSITATPTAICVGFSSNLAASGANSYTWSPNTALNNTNSANVTANPSNTTLYTASGTNANGCVGTQTINLIVNPLPNISINPSTPIVLGGQGPTITANGANTYSWSPATNLSSTSGSTVTATPQITTNYTLTGTSSAGCVSNDMFSVGVELWQQTADTFHAPIYYNGNVGIGTGTNTPQAALDVVGNAIITGTLTTGGLNSTSSNLRVATPAVFNNTVTVSSLSGGSGLQPLYVDSLGNLRQGNNPNINPLLPTGINSCQNGNPPWQIGGNRVLGYSGSVVLGTCDNYPLAFEAGGNASMWLKPSGQLGIGNPHPSSTDYVEMYNSVGYSNILNLYNSSFNSVFNVQDNGSTVITGTSIVNGSSIINSTSTTNAPLTIQAGSTNLFNVSSNGKVGIGTASPLFNLHVASSSGTNANSSVYSTNGNATSWVYNDILSYGLNIDPSGNGHIISNINSIVGNLSSASPMNIMSFNGLGQVFIGTSMPNSSNTIGALSLNVYGGINTTALYVTDPASKWSDFVFDNNYKLMPLKELEIFYKMNHHLPSVPTTKEIQEKGNNLAETDAILLQKIEELTLYLVEQQKMLEKQQLEIAKLKNRQNNK